MDNTHFYYFLGNKKYPEIYILPEYLQTRSLRNLWVILLSVAVAESQAARQWHKTQAQRRRRSKELREIRLFNHSLNRLGRETHHIYKWKTYTVTVAEEVVILIDVNIVPLSIVSKYWINLMRRKTDLTSIIVVTVWSARLTASVEGVANFYHHRDVGACMIFVACFNRNLSHSWTYNLKRVNTHS